MTINSQTRTAGPFAGTGTIVPYPFTFKVFQASDLQVVLTSAGLTQTTLTLSSDYTVTLNADQNIAPGGTITPLIAVAVGATLSATSRLPIVQPASLTNSGGFYPKVIEDALDRLTILMQEQGYVSSLQTLRVPELGGVSLLPIAAARANYLLGFDSNGNPVAVAPASGSAAALAADLANNTNAAKGSAQVGYFPAGAGAVPSNVQTELRERPINAKRFGLSTLNTRAQNDAAIYAAINSGARSVFIPNGYPDKYLLSAKIVVTAAAQGIKIYGENKQNTVLSWQIDTATTDKFGFLVDGFFSMFNLTLENTGSDKTNSSGLCSYSITLGNGMHDCMIGNIKMIGWGVPIGATIDGTSLSMVRSQAFSNTFKYLSFYSCGPIKLGAGVNNNVWIKPSFWGAIGNRHFYFVEGGGNKIIAPQFEPVDASVTTGFANAEFVRSINNVIDTPYFEPCYGVVADSSPGTSILTPLCEGFDYVVGNLTNSSILRSTNASNAGVFQSPMVSKVTLPVSRASVNPICYAVSDDNINTLTLIDVIAGTRDANFKKRPAGQSNGEDSISYRGTFVPTLIGSSGTNVHTYSQQQGWYIRIGQLVTCFYRVGLSAKDAGMAGNVSINGLPFPNTVDSLYAASSALAEYRVDLTTGYTAMSGETVAGGTAINLVQNGDNVAALSLPASGVLAFTGLTGQISYITDSV